jgi:hypothetical protein
MYVLPLRKEPAVEGFLQVINLLLAITGFGITTNPSPPTADAALTYAMPDADVIAHFDAVGVIPGNFKVLQALPSAPEIKGSPELRDQIKAMVANVEGGRGLIKGMVGIDFVTDITDMTAFVQKGKSDRPDFVAAIHGKFNVASIAKIAKAAHGTLSADGASVAIDGDMTVGITKSGVMLVGTPSLVTPRMAATWKAPVRGKDSLLAKAAEVIDSKPMFAVMAALSPSTRKELASRAGENFVSDLLTRHKFVSFSLYSDGVGWIWDDNSKAGAERMGMFSDGLIDLMRAAQVAPRGISKILLSALDSYKGKAAIIDQLIANKAKISAALTSYVGDGQFKVTQSVDPKTMRVSVRATGKTLSEVLPVGFLGPVMGVGMWTVKSPPTSSGPARSR